MALFDTRFPDAPRRPHLNATLIATYAAYGASDAVIDHGRRFLTTFPDTPDRTAVTLAMADAFARKDQVTEEFAAYDRLLQELAVRADRVPLGVGSVPAEGGRQTRSTGARSRKPDACSRYIARLVERRQLRDALAVYRRGSIATDDPGIYAEAAQFLEQNSYTAEVEQVYRLAIQQFRIVRGIWLARWYLGHSRAAAFPR